MSIATYLIIIFISLFHLLIINRNHYNKIRNYALTWSFILLILFNIFVISYNQTLNFQFIYNIKWTNISYNFSWGEILLGLDGFSIIFIELSLILIPLCLLSSWNLINYLIKEFVLCLFSNLILLILVFSVLEILSFYIIFEITLIPMFLIIGIWGSRTEKIRASFYFFFYTLVGSFLMLLSIFKIFSLSGSGDYIYFNYLKLFNQFNIWIFLGFFISLAVKIPMFPVHLWLPKAHVEAPLAGSILLAGILLKLGGYGFIRFVLPIMPYFTNYLSPVIILLSIIAVTYGALTTLKQNDIKKLIAYSSISHMGLVTLSIFTQTSIGIIGSVIMMFSHGLISSGLFIMSSALYSRFHSRIIKYYKGITLVMPILATLSLILTLSNMAFPLTMNFMAELFIIKSSLFYSFKTTIILCIGCFITTSYSLFIYNRIFFGSISYNIISTRDINNLEINPFILIIFIILILGITPYEFINYLILPANIVLIN